MEQVESKDDNQIISATVCAKGELPDLNKQPNQVIKDQLG